MIRIEDDISERIWARKRGFFENRVTNGNNTERNNKTNTKNANKNQGVNFQRELRPRKRT